MTYVRVGPALEHAYATCVNPRGFGGDLVSIGSQAELDAVLAFAASESPARRRRTNNGEPVLRFYTGARRTSDEPEYEQWTSQDSDAWEYTDGTQWVKSSLHTWATNEPNYYKRKEHCVLMSIDGIMNDARCWLNEYAICRRVSKTHIFTHLP